MHVPTRATLNWPFFTSRETGTFLSISRDLENFSRNNLFIINCNTYLIRGPRSRRGCGLFNYITPSFLIQIIAALLSFIKTNMSLFSPQAAYLRMNRINMKFHSIARFCDLGNEKNIFS